MLIFDHRWMGTHGIGRFAREVAARIEHVELKTGGRPMSPLDPLRLAVALRCAGRRDLFLSPGYNAPLWSRQPFVLTVHDLNHIDRSENSSLAKRIYYEFVLKRACSRAARVLTVSEFARRRIIEWAGISDSQVVNVGNGVADHFNTNAKAAPRENPYYLCVSNRRPHKNESRVLAALQVAALPLNVELLLTGEETQSLHDEISRRGLEKRVHFTGTVSDADLASLYRGSIGLVFPSLYEGFGLPVVEAMACGTPVITSVTTALPEVAGEAALLVDPLSVDAIAGAMVRLHDDRVFRTALGAAGVRRASQFSWTTVGQRVATTLAAL